MSTDSQRAQLHQTIWKIANELRGSVDGWDFRNYVLGMLFYRFISENTQFYFSALETGCNQAESTQQDYAQQDYAQQDYAQQDYAQWEDSRADKYRQQVVAHKGLFIYPSQLFSNVAKQAPTNPDVAHTLDKVFCAVEDSARGTASEKSVAGLFGEIDCFSPKLGNTTAERNRKLVLLLEATAQLPLGNFGQDSIDLFGDAYEYLVNMYASQAGKSGGEFFTPQEVSELLAQLTIGERKKLTGVYDPAVGSGSLLLKFTKLLGEDNIGGFSGQEINLTSYNLARMNMFLHNIPFQKFDIALGNTLTDPQHRGAGMFDAVVSNPPYSIRWAGDSDPKLTADPRFAPAGVLAPKSKADLAFVMHILSVLSAEGTAAIVEFPGVLYRGGAEKKIRQYLLESNAIDAVIQLPPDLFFGTTIATCIIVLKKNRPSKDVLFIDASQEFARTGKKNQLSAAHREAILELFLQRKAQAGKAVLITPAEIARHGYNLSVDCYLQPEAAEEEFDLHELEARAQQLVKRQQELRQSISKILSEFM